MSTAGDKFDLNLLGELWIITRIAKLTKNIRRIRRNPGALRGWGFFWGF
jgi:hypothetical protein